MIAWQPGELAGMAGYALFMSFRFARGVVSGAGSNQIDFREGRTNMAPGKLLAVSALCWAGGAAVAHAAMGDKFLMRSTADLVSICTASSSDPYYTAAVNFCQGVVVGVVRTLEETEAGAKQQLFCLPAAMPTRSQTITAYVQWASGSPDRLAMQPTDSIGQYLSETYPCR